MGYVIGSFSGDLPWQLDTDMGVIHGGTLIYGNVKPVAMGSIDCLYGFTASSRNGLNNLDMGCPVLMPAGVQLPSQMGV